MLGLDNIPVISEPEAGPRRNSAYTDPRRRSFDASRASPRIPAKSPERRSLVPAGSRGEADSLSAYMYSERRSSLQPRSRSPSGEMSNYDAERRASHEVSPGAHYFEQRSSLQPRHSASLDTSSQNAEQTASPEPLASAVRPGPGAGHVQSAVRLPVPTQRRSSLQYPSWEKGETQSHSPSPRMDYAQPTSSYAQSPTMSYAQSPVSSPPMQPTEMGPQAPYSDEPPYSYGGPPGGTAGPSQPGYQQQMYYQSPPQGPQFRPAPVYPQTYHQVQNVSYPSGMVTGPFPPQLAAPNHPNSHPPIHYAPSMQRPQLYSSPLAPRPLPPHPGPHQPGPHQSWEVRPVAPAAEGPGPHVSFTSGFTPVPPPPRRPSVSTAVSTSPSDEDERLAASMASVDMGTPPVAPSDAPRPTFRKLTVRKPARNPAVGPTPTAPTAEESKANVTKVSLLKTIEMYRLNALKSGDSGLKFEFAKYCIEESVKAPDQKTRDLMIEEGFSLLKELGRAGSSEAMYTLGQAYLDDQQFSLAHSQLLAAAKRSHPGAMYLLGIMSEKGAGTKKSTRVAMDFYTKSAQAGYKPALYRLGMIELFGQLSGGKKDVKKGIMWLKRGAAVADRDHPECLHQLALVYEDGLPPHAQQDESYAKGLLIEAAELDYAPSQYKLACCYEFERLGCERDLSEAMHWYTLAAENDNADAQFALAGWYLQGLEGMLPADPYKAYAWTYRAAMKDHAKAQYAIGYFCDLGIGCEQNQEKADRWYRLAAALGEERAIAKVGLPPPPHDGKKSTRSLSPSELNQHMQPNAAPPGKEAKGLFSFLKK